MFSSPDQRDKAVGARQGFNVPALDLRGAAMARERKRATAAIVNFILIGWEGEKLVVV